MGTEAEDYQSTFALVVNGKVVHISKVHNVLADIYRQSPTIVDVTQYLGTNDQIEIDYNYDGVSFSIPEGWETPNIPEVPATVFVSTPGDTIDSPEPLAEGYTESLPQ